MKQGDKVMIYEKPLTQEKPEGMAILLEEYRPDDGDGISQWIVLFADDTVCVRTIVESPIIYKSNQDNKE